MRNNSKKKSVGKVVILRDKQTEEAMVKADEVRNLLCEKCSEYEYNILISGVVVVKWE